MGLLSGIWERERARKQPCSCLLRSQIPEQRRVLRGIKVHWKQPPAAQNHPAAPEKHVPSSIEITLPLTGKIVYVKLKFAGCGMWTIYAYASVFGHQDFSPALSLPSQS